jgi:hypothetical protein
MRKMNHVLCKDLRGEDVCAARLPVPFPAFPADSLLSSLLIRLLYWPAFSGFSRCFKGLPLSPARFRLLLQEFTGRAAQRAPLGLSMPDWSCSSLRAVKDDRFHVLRHPSRPIRFDLGDLGGNPALGLHRVISILQPQEVTLRQTKEFAQAQVRIAGDVASAVYDGVDAIARYTDRMRELVLAHANLDEEFFLQNLAGMGVAKLRHDRVLLIGDTYPAFSRAVATQGDGRSSISLALQL